MSTVASILLGNTVDVLGRPCDFDAVAVATLRMGRFPRWTVVGFGGDFTELDRPESVSAQAGGNLLVHGILALLATNEITYAARRGALASSYVYERYAPSTDAAATSLPVLAAEVPEDWVLILTLMPGGAISSEDVVAVARAGICVVLASLPLLAVDVA